MTRFEQILAVRIVVQFLMIISGAVLGLDTVDHLRDQLISNMAHSDEFFTKLDKK